MNFSHILHPHLRPTRNDYLKFIDGKKVVRVDITDYELSD